MPVHENAPPSGACSPLRYASSMPFVSLLSDSVEQELSWLARTAGGGVLLISPSGDVAFVRGDVTPDAARLARTNAHRAAASLNAAPVFMCDVGSWVQVLSIADGWVLGVETRVVPAQLPTSFRLLLRRALGKLTLWLAYTQLAHLRDNERGHGGAPAEAVAVLPSKRRN